ncbi:MAG: glycosyltransferase family 4 protein [Melioribacter sp.]|nr:glycosyltransferase family 4 protein [Melioribacter sp.]
MKILQLLPKIPYPPYDGHKKSMWGVIKSLSELGHEIDVIAYGQNQDYKNLIGEIKKYANLYVVDLFTGNSVSGAIKNLFSKMPYNISKYKTKEYEEFLTRHLESNKYDIIHVTNAHMGWTIDVVRKLCKAPVVLREENFELAIMERYYKNQSNLVLKLYAFLQYRKFLSYEPQLCGKFDSCIMMSNEDRNRLTELNPLVKAKVIPLGIDKELLEIEREETEKFSLVHVGSLEWYPNYDGLKWFINNVFPLIVDKFKETKLYLYGGGITKNFYFHESIKDNIIVKGFVSNIWDDVKNKSLAVVPLRIGSGIRVKILEMLASGLNVITTSLGKEGIPVTDAEELLIADDENEFARKIIEYFSGQYDSKQFSLKGKELIRKKYLWEEVAEQFESTYNELIS